MIDDLKKFLDGVQAFLDLLFGGKAPSYLLPTIGWVLAIGIILYSLVFSLGLIKKLWVEFIQPVFYKPEDRRRGFRRRMFADHIESEIRNMNSLESWNDNRFTELEAHVEAEGGQRLFGLFLLRMFRSSGIRLEKSLSKAIEKSNERLVLLEGDPGSGKSVALRHVAQLMARKAHTSRNLRTRIPIYVNLKYLRRAEGENIDRLLLEKFIFKTLNRVNDRDVDEYLHDEFKRGLEEGTWFFLFDSFDEIPEILSSTGADDVIRDYAEAIRDFLHGMNNCKGMVASREYKGPRFLGWPKFRVLPLETSRRVNLVRRTNLPLNIQKSIIEGLAISIDDFRVMASNPMFLNLICDFMNKPIIPEFPKHIHIVFQEYVYKRLTRDEERVKGRFNKTPQDVQDAAEKFAYCMTADQGIGLSPTLEQLENSTIKLNLNLGEDFNVFVEALAYLKLARIDTSFVDVSKTFTFAHRRFQEYFATAIVLRQPDRVSNYDLLTNGRWRETAVVIIQTQSSDRVASLFTSAEQILKNLGGAIIEEYRGLKAVVPSIIDLPRYHFWSLVKRLFEPLSRSRSAIRHYFQSIINNSENSKGAKKLEKPIDWPDGLYHLFSILQEGTTGSSSRFSANLQLFIDELIMSLSERGDILDENWCLELAGVTSDKYLIKLIEKGIGRGSRIAKQISFKQLSKLPKIHKPIENFINRTLCEMAVSVRLLYERQEVFAQLSRIQGGSSYVLNAKFLIWAPAIDLLMILSGLSALMFYDDRLPLIPLLIFLVVVWVATWFSGDLFISYVSRTVFVGMFLVFVAIGSSVILTSPSKLFNLFQWGSLLQITKFSIWYFINSIGWGMTLVVLMVTGRIPRFIWWPFLGLIPALIILMFLVIVLISEPLLSFLRVFGVYLVILFSLDWIYLFTRSLLIFQEMPRKKKISEIFSSIVFSDPKAIVLLMVEFFALVFPVVFLSEALAIILAIIYFGVLVTWIGPDIYYFLQGALIYSKWKQKTKPQAFLMFIQELELNKSGYFRLRMLKRTNDKQLIETQTDDVHHLRNLISFASARVMYKSDGQHERIMEIDPSLGNVLKTDIWDIEQIDELLRLLDKFQSARIAISS